MKYGHQKENPPTKGQSIYKKETQRHQMMLEESKNATPANPNE
jgi:hypothetical protein